MKKNDLKHYLNLYKCHSGFFRNFRNSSGIRQLKAIYRTALDEKDDILSDARIEEIKKLCQEYQGNHLTDKILKEIHTAISPPSPPAREMKIKTLVEDFTSLSLPDEDQKDCVPSRANINRLEELGWYIDEEIAKKNTKKMNYILEKSIVAPKATYWYHGTSTRHYKKIRDEGLNSRLGEHVNEGLGDPDRTCFSADFYCIHSQYAVGYGQVSRNNI